MQIIAILIGLGLLAAIAYYVSRPLLRQRGGVDVTTIASLELQRDALYAQIRELDMDHATGKTNDEDYQQIRAELVAQAADVLKRIDGVATTPVPAPVPAPQSAAARPANDDVEALIAARRKTSAAPSTAPKPAVDDLEAAIAARRKTTVAGPAAAKPADDEVETLIAARRKPTSSAPVCPNCGKPVAADDAFCAKCGTSLHARTVSQA